MAMECKLIVVVGISLFLQTKAQILGHSPHENLGLASLMTGLVQEFLTSSAFEDKSVTDDNSIGDENNAVDGFQSANPILSEINNIINNEQKPSFSNLDQLLAAVVLKQLEKSLQVGKREKYKELANDFAVFNTPFQGCSNESYPTSESGKIKTYSINLDFRPEERWKDVIKEKRDEIKRLADYFEILFGKKFMSAVDKYITWLHHTLPQEYFLELKGISQLTGISIGRITLYNVFYEFFSVCTSIIVEGEDGRMYHGRNLDFGLFMGWDSKKHIWFVTDILRPLIIKLDFWKNGKPLYSAVTYAGFTGILTGVKKNIFSLTINERFIMDGGYVGIAEWIVGRRDISWIGLLTRRVMESADSYQQAQQLLTTTNLVAPVYFILAGNTSQGCIITRGRRDFDVWQLGNRHEHQSGTWYLVETNQDHWRPMPFFDHRREYAIQCMEKYGRQLPLETLYKVLSTKPVLNKLTTYTALMDVTTGQLLVWERECKDPCWPI